MDKPTFLANATQALAAYQANSEVLSQLSQVDLVAIVGPTGVGKSTLTHRAGLHFVLSDVTRPPREGERNGLDYHFRSDYDQLWQEVQNGEFVQYVVERNGEFYGTKAASYPTQGTAAMSIISTVIPIFRSLGFRSVRPVYIVPPSYSEWMHRIANHRDKDLEGRLMEAKESIAIALNDPAYVYLLNDDLEEATQTLKNIVAGKVDAGLSARARNAANQLHEHLEKVIR